MPHHTAIIVERGGILTGIAGGKAYGVKRVFIFWAGGAEGQHLQARSIFVRGHAPAV